MSGAPTAPSTAPASTRWRGWTKAMALEWAPHGIRVNTICPTFIRTPLAEQTLKDPERRAWILSKIKLGRVGEIEDVMGPVVFPRLRGLGAGDGHPPARRRGVDRGMTLAPRESHSPGCRPPCRREPVGGQPRVHPRRLGQQGDHRQGPRRGRAAGLPPRSAGARDDHRAHPDHRAGGGLPRKPVLPDRAGTAVAGLCRNAATTSSCSWPRNSTEKVAEVVQELIDYRVDGIVTASVAMSNDNHRAVDGGGGWAFPWSTSTAGRMMRG